jgi:hypothetical protein
MSLNVPRVPVAKVMDPRLEINRVRDYVALKGSMVNTFQAFPATNVNNSSIQITCNPPNRGIVVSRLVFKEVEFRIQIAGTNLGGGNLLTAGHHGPRAYPLASVTASEQITLNNDTLCQAPVRQYWPALLWYHNEWKNRFGQYSLTPSMMDQHPDYEQAVGGIRNPLGRYNDNSFEQTRASFSDYDLKQNTATYAEIILKVTEPVLISPLVFGEHSNFTSGLAGIQNMSYTATLGSLDRVMSLIKDQGAPGVKDITNIQVDVRSARLLFNYLTPDPLNPVPRNLVSSYYSLVSYPTKTSAPIVPNGEVTITMQSIQVTSIPRRIILFCREDDIDQTPYTSDTFLPLANGCPLSVTWNNNQFMSQASTQDLYNIAVKNNCSMSYSQFIGYTGSCLTLDFGTDIGLMSDESPGSLGNYQMSLTARFRNNKNANITPTLYVVVVYEGTFNVRDGNCSHMIGVLSRQDVLNAKRVPGITYKKAYDVYGGSFYTRVKDALRSAHDYAKEHKLLSKGLKLIPDQRAQMASRVAENLGYGISGGNLRGGAIKKKSKKSIEEKLQTSLISDLADSDSEY